MEGDIEITVITHVTTTISIHSLRMEGDKYDPYRWKW